MPDYIPPPDYIEPPDSKKYVAPPDAAQEWQKSGYGFDVKPAVTPDTNKPTVQSREGYLWYGPEQGNPDPKGGWFNAQGQPVQPQQTEKPTVPSVGKAMLQGVLNTPLTSNPLLMGQGLKNVAELAAGKQGYEHYPTLGTASLGALKTAAAPVQFIANKLGGGQYVNPLATSLQEVANQNLVPSTTGEMVGAGALTSAIPMGGVSRLAGGVKNALEAIKLGKLAGPMANVLTQAGIGAAVAPLTTLETNVKDQEDFNARKVQEEIAGGVFGAKAASVIEAISAVPALLNAAKPLLNRIAIGSPQEQQAALAELEQIRQATASAKYPQGAEPTLGEVAKSPTLRTIENTSEYFPWTGRQPQLEQQNAALAEKAAELAGKPSASVAYQPKTGALAAPEIGTGNLGTAISESAKRELANKRAPAVALYNEVRDAVQTPPKLNNTLKAYDSAISEAETLFGPNSEQVNILRSEKSNLVAKPGVTEQVVTGYDAYGSPIYGTRATGATPAKTFSEIEQLQDIQQQLRESGRKSENETQQILSRYRRNIGRAMGDDLIAAADEVGVGGKIREANKIYGETFKYDPNAHGDWADMKTRTASRTIHGSEGYEQNIPKNLLQGDNPATAKHAFDSLDPNGHEAMKQAILENILEAGKTPGGQVFSAKKAANAIGDHRNFINQFFGEDGRFQLDGFQKALEMMQRSGQYQEALTTGKFGVAIKGISSLGSAGLAAATGHPGIAAVAVAPTASLRLFNWISGTPEGKAWLMKMSDAPANSKMAQNLMEQLPKIIAVSPKNQENK